MRKGGVRKGGVRKGAVRKGVREGRSSEEGGGRKGEYLLFLSLLLVLWAEVCCQCMLRFTASFHLA